MPANDIAKYYAKLKTGATSRKCEANGGMENVINKFYFDSLLSDNFAD